MQQRNDRNQVFGIYSQQIIYVTDKKAGDRYVTVINGLPFYQSSGSNSHEKGTWFPFMGLNEVGINFAPKGLFLKPTTSVGNAHECYPAALANYFIKNQALLGNIITRFGNYEALCLSMLIGGGFWDSTEGMNFKNFIEATYPGDIKNLSEKFKETINQIKACKGAKKELSVTNDTVLINQWLKNQGSIANQNEQGLSIDFQYKGFKTQPIIKNELILSSAQTTGGVTGSFRVKGLDNKYYQLKPSIKDNDFTRQAKANFTDRENIGEFIASCIGRCILGESRANAVPEVFLVYNTKDKRVLIASKYLEGNNGVRVLDEFAKENGASVKDNSHISLVAGNSIKQHEVGINSAPMTSLKKSLAIALVISAILGDHDVNPGNMVVTTQDGKSSIARIDFGHAFNDLLNTFASFGGTVLNPENRLHDFLNRTNVAGLSLGGAPSKLWRDYPGFVFSQEMADALKEIANVSEAEVARGIKKAKASFKELIETMQENNDTAGLDHVYKSLLEIHNNISDKKIIDLSESTNRDSIAINSTNKNHLVSSKKQWNLLFDGLQAFVIKNLKDARNVGILMETQLCINEMLSKKHSFYEIIEELKTRQLLPKADESIQWIKENKDQSPFTGTIGEYIARKQVIIFNTSFRNENSMLAAFILNELDQYTDKVKGQLLQTVGLIKLKELEKSLYIVLLEINNGEMGEALKITQQLKDKLVHTYGKDNMVGKSSAFNLVCTIEDKLLGRLKKMQLSQEPKLQTIPAQDTKEVMSRRPAMPLPNKPNTLEPSKEKAINSSYSPSCLAAKRGFFSASTPPSPKVEEVATTNIIKKSPNS